MRMKAVCEATGLTDRTVRYYIEEGLISPDYTESYTGRKTFDFCEADIHQLNDIAVLRKFGFTVAEIREMLHDPARIMPTLETLRQRKQAQISEEQTLMLALDRITVPFRSVKELALALSAPVETALVPAEDRRIGIGTTLKNLILTTIRGYVAWSPIAVSIVMMVSALRTYLYPQFQMKMFALLMAFLTPSVMILNWHRLQERFDWQKKAKSVLWALCILSIIPCALFAGTTFSHSETTNIHNYRIFDGRCRINQSTFFHEFFPENARFFDLVEDENGKTQVISLGAQYYYRHETFIDSTYIVYAEWPLESEDFDEEVARVRNLFANDEQQGHYVHEETQKGSWSCLTHYSQAQKPTADSYGNFLFAYNPETLRVRYICCDSLENGMDQPYYLELDWE